MVLRALIFISVYSVSIEIAWSTVPQLPGPDCVPSFAQIAHPELTEADLDKILAEQKETLEKAAKDEAVWSQADKARVKKEAKWAKQIEREKKILERYAQLEEVPLPETKQVEFTRDLDVRKMTESGIQTRVVDIEPVVSHSVTDGNMVPIKDAVREVVGLPKPFKKPDVFTNMFFHPELPDYIARMKALGYRLVVDSTLAHSSASAITDRINHVIRVNPLSQWNHFLHEFEHLKINIFLDAVNSPKVKSYIDKNAKIPGELVAILGPKGTKWINDLYKEGMSINAIHETLAVNTQLEAIGFRRFIPGTMAHDEAAQFRMYALRHQITDVLNIHPADRTREQIARLNRALTEIRLLENRKAISSGSGLLAVATFATAIGMNRDDIRDMIYSEKERVIYVFDKAGRWIKVQWR